MQSRSEEIKYERLPNVGGATVRRVAHSQTAEGVFRLKLGAAVIQEHRNHPRHVEHRYVLLTQTVDVHTVLLF